MSKCVNLPMYSKKMASRNKNVSKYNANIAVMSVYFFIGLIFIIGRVGEYGTPNWVIPLKWFNLILCAIAIIINIILKYK